MLKELVQQSKLHAGDLLKGARYTIVRSVGQGQMSPVYKAWDAESREFVAVKIATKSEVAVLARLDHSQIPTLVDSFIERGQEYVVMQYLDDDNFETVLSYLCHTKFPLADVLDFALQICEILAYAHARGVVHRDLKPGNIIVIDGRVYLIDFGIAKLFEAGVTAHLTRDVEALGNSCYAAPEQIDGMSGPQSDIYALFVMMHEMLTGKRAFSHPKFEFEPLTEDAGGVAKKLETLVLEGLHAEHDNRPDAETLCVELRRMMNDLTTHSC